MMSRPAPLALASARLRLTLAGFAREGPGTEEIWPRPPGRATSDSDPTRTPAFWSVAPLAESLRESPLSY